MITIEREGGNLQFDIDPRHVTIDPTNLDFDLCNIGKIMLQYGELESELRMEVSRKEARIEHFKAELDSAIRVEAAGTSGKITENQIKSKICQNEAYIDSLDSLRTSQRNLNVMRWCMTALNKKSDCLIAFSYRERALIKADGA